MRMAGIDQNVEKSLIPIRSSLWHVASLGTPGPVAEYIFEDLVRIPVKVEYTSEFRYRNPVITENNVLMAISQSRETTDILAAIKLAKGKGIFIWGL